MASIRLLRRIPEDQLNKKLTEQQLAKISKRLSEWQVKGSVFGLTKEEMEDIKEDHKYSNEMQKVAMLRRWAMKNGDQASLRVLIEMSCDNGWTDFAENACISLGYIQKKDGKVCVAWLLN